MRRLDTKVVRTIVTGNFQNINIPLISTSSRIFEFGKKFGYIDRELKYEELFMGKFSISEKGLLYGIYKIVIHI